MTHEEQRLHQQLTKLLEESKEKIVKFKNYRVMCEALGLDVKSSNSKTAQLERLENFCNLRRDEKGWGYNYTEVYADPDELMLQKDAITSEMEKILLLTFLADDEEYPGELFLSKFEAWRLFGLINSKYAEEKFEERFQETNKVTSKQLASYKNKSQDKFGKTLKRVLDKLRDCAYIDYVETRIITYEDNDGQLVEREATTQEIQRATIYSREVLSEMKCKNMSQVYLHCRNKEYHGKMYRLYNKNENWLNYRFAYKIIPVSKKWLEEGLRCNLEACKKHQLNVNANIIESLRRSSAVTYNNYRKALIEEYGSRHWAERGKFDTYERKGKVLSDDYLNKFGMFLDEFIQLSE